MDTFDVNLLSQVQALTTKLSISQEHLHPKKKAGSEERARGKRKEKTTAKTSEPGRKEQTALPGEDAISENIINITV
ncbi:MAG: hypothetical protein A4E65_01338 [Syntrophorhabdus sp. PtaU1.Bin153]|nr:MAG: hypothetical protein A4E65_01338 [Syntrophorhabdus sp. PtaU1.Bin153]